MENQATARTGSDAVPSGVGRGSGARLWLTVAVSIVAGLTEWAVRESMGLGLGQRDASRTLLAIVAFYGLLGMVLGGLVAALGRKPAVSISIAPAALMGLAVLDSMLEAARVAVAAFAALASVWLCLQLLGRFLAPRPFLLRPHLWWTVQGLVLAVALALTAARAPDGRGMGIALGAAAGAILLLAWGATSRRNASHPPWQPVIATAILVVASALLGARVPVVGPSAAADPSRPSVLLITIDTLRADHVGAYGYARARTPNLDRLAERGILFREVIAPHVLTGPSHASILTGLLPETHGVLLNGERLPHAVSTLADAFGAEGYATAAFASSFTTSDRACGLPSRFSAYDDDLRRAHWLPSDAYRGALLLKAFKVVLTRSGVDFSWPVYRPGAETADIAIAWLSEQARTPFFAWVHLFDPHLPYKPPAAHLTEIDRAYQGPASGEWYVLDPADHTAIVSSTENLDHMIALYDAEIAYADEQVGRLVDKALDVADNGNLLTIVTADHGEQMGEHGLFWSRDLYEPTVRVPLIWMLPTGTTAAVNEVSTPVRLIDIAPTVLDLVGIPDDPSFDGASLAGLVRGETGEPPGPAYSLTFYASSEFRRRSVSVRDRGWKLIWRAPGWSNGKAGRWDDTAREELYDLSQDPSEERNVVDKGSAILDELRQGLAPRKDVSGPRGDAPPEDLERLRSLGYAR